MNNLVIIIIAVCYTIVCLGYCSKVRNMNTDNMPFIVDYGITLVMFPFAVILKIGAKLAEW